MEPFPRSSLQGRYGEAILFRHHNNLNPDVSQNGGFGASHDQYARTQWTSRRGERRIYRRILFSGTVYDYHWPIVHAGCDSMNTDASDSRCGSPADSGGINNLPGDWCETMSTHWFHDHMFSFTAQNVYKGNAAMFNLYSALDRGNEAIDDGVNLRLPSGTDRPGATWITT